MTDRHEARDELRVVLAKLRYSDPNDQQKSVELLARAEELADELYYGASYYYNGLTMSDIVEAQRDERQDAIRSSKWFDQQDHRFGVAYGHYEDVQVTDDVNGWIWDQPRENQNQQVVNEYSTGPEASVEPAGFGDAWCRGRDLSDQHQEWHYGRWVPAAE